MTDTPTPPMTPEQRAELVKATKVKAAMINLGEAIQWGSETILMEQCADQLEADGVTIATITAERDAAEFRETMAANKAVEYLERAEAAEAALATAREDGMREAMQIAIGRKGLGALEMTHPYERGYSAACDTILAAIQKGAAT